MVGCSGQKARKYQESTKIFIEREQQTQRGWHSKGLQMKQNEKISADNQVVTVAQKELTIVEGYGRVGHLSVKMTEDVANVLAGS
jgi:hypothetical protein